MRIGKEYKPCEVKFGNGLKIGETFYYRGEYDVTRCDVYRRNAVNLEDGSLTFVDDDDTVTIANVYIEKD